MLDLAVRVSALVVECAPAQFGSSVSSFSPSVTLADGALTLVSPWKPLLLLLPIMPWAYVCSKVFDKFTAQYHLSREKWNTINLIWGTLAFLIAVAMPIQESWAIFVSVAVQSLLLFANIFVFMKVNNQDERLPDGRQLKWSDLFAGNADKKKKSTKETKDQKGGGSELVVRGTDKIAIVVPARETPEFAMRLAAEKLVLSALDLRASQVDLIPTGKDPAYAVSYLVDSVRQTGESMPAADAMKLIDFWKTAAKLDVADRRKRLVGDCRVEKGTDTKLLRVISSGSQQGVRLSIIVEPEKAVRRNLEQSGLMEQQIAELKAIVADGKGVVLLSAPADQGRTTTMYMVLRMHDAYTSNVQTVEVDVQDSLEGARQNKFDPGQPDGPEYFTLVRSILRRDPNVVAVAELPDTATAKEIAKVDPERTRIYTSIPADNAMAAIMGYVGAVADAEAAGKTLRGVVSQKLMRKLCGNCKQAYQPTPDVLKKLGLPADKVKQLFKKGGQVLIKNKPEICPACKGSGYFGAEGIFEVFQLDDACRDRIKQKDFVGLKGELRKRQLPSMQQSALRRAIDGTTSVEEVVRITSDGKEGAGGTGTAQAPAVTPGPKPVPAKQ